MHACVWLASQLVHIYFILHVALIHDYQVGSPLVFLALRHPHIRMIFTNWALVYYLLLLLDFVMLSCGDYLHRRVLRLLSNTAKLSLVVFVLECGHECFSNFFTFLGSHFGYLLVWTGRLVVVV